MNIFGFFGIFSFSIYPEILLILLNVSENISQPFWDCLESVRMWHLKLYFSILPKFSEYFGVYLNLSEYFPNLFGFWICLNLCASFWITFLNHWIVLHLSNFPKLSLNLNFSESNPNICRSISELFRILSNIFKSLCISLNPSQIYKSLLKWIRNSLESEKLEWSVNDHRGKLLQKHEWPGHLSSDLCKLFLNIRNKLTVAQLCWLKQWKEKRGLKFRYNRRWK